MNGRADRNRSAPAARVTLFGRTLEAADAVVLAATLLVLAIVAIFVALCFEGYATTIREAKARAERSASVVALGSRWMIASMLSALEASASADASGSGIHNNFADRANLASNMSAASYDVAGRGQESVNEAVPVDIAGQDYFRELAAGREWALGAQEPLANGTAAFAIARRMEREGLFDGAVVVFVDSRILESLATPQDLGPESTISLVRTDGWIIARNPPLANPTDLSGTAAMGHLTSAQSGAYESAISPVDGVTRFVGFSHVPELGYVAVASISKSTALAGLWYSIWVVSLLIAPIALAVLGGSLVTARLLRRKQAAQRSLTQALEHNEVLFREIHHRVKNNLQSINSLLQIHPIPRDVRADISRRIFAMSAVHEHIYRSNTFDNVRIRGYLHTLISKIREGADPKVKVIEELEDVVVDKDAAAPLGLILNEVLTNSIKHAFAGRDSGQIRVALSTVSPGVVELTVEDDGPGFDPSRPSKGIGRRLIDGFAAQLHGSITHSGTDGYRFSMRFSGRPAESERASVSG